MQPLLRRVATRVHEVHRIEGPVFWRHYASRACLDPSHARNAVAYVHLNPVRAGICDDAGDYPWSSHSLYARGSNRRNPDPVKRLAAVLDPTPALRLFATEPNRSIPELRTDYRAFVAWLRSVDEVEPSDDEMLAGVAMPSHATTPRLASAWPGALSPFFHEPVWMGPSHAPPHGAPDMATIAHWLLAAEAPGLTLALMRESKGGRERVRVRHLMIRRLSAAGYSNAKIARFLGLSDSAVSYVLRKSA